MYDRMTNTPTKLKYPTTHNEWQELYGWLRDAYVLDDYTIGDIKGLHLFRALNDQGQEIHVARRVVQDAQYIVDTDARALAGASVSLEADTPDALIAGEAVWRRSRVPSQIQQWALTCAMLGDMHLEIVNTEQGARIVAHHPANVRLDYDPTDPSVLIRAVIGIRFGDPPEVDANGAFGSEEITHYYQRILTRDQIVVTLDGQPVFEQSGANMLGVVPLVHVPFAPVDEPEHGLSAAWGAWRAVAIADSLIAQNHAIASRYADPKITIKGARLAEDGSGIQFGRYISGIPANGEVAYLESSLSGAQTSLEILNALRAIVREAPEFLFTETGANASGTSMSFRATSFESKMLPIRARFFEAIATAVQMGVELDRGVVHDPDLHYTISAPPVLPVNKNDEVTTIIAIKREGGLSDGDFIRHLQRLGFVESSHLPDEYSEQVRADTSAYVSAIERGSAPKERP